MAVHYKLKSSRKFESVFFEGHEITGRELKAEIAAKQDLGADAIAELTLTNPKTGDEYDDARGIPRNSSVLVTRKPPVRFAALQAASTAAAADAAQAPPSSSAAPEAAAEEGDEFGEAYSEQPQAAVLPDEDIAQALASQQQSWQAGLAAGGRGGRGGRGAGGRSGRGPGGFAALPQRPDDRPCPRCGQTGHRQQDCPTRDNPEFDVKRVHMPRGIPTSLLQASVAGEGSMVLPDGKIGTLRANEAAFLREMQASRTALAARAAPTALPSASTSSAQPATTAALPAPAVSAAPAVPLLLTQKPYDGAAASAPASAVLVSAPPVAASALAAVPQFAGASEYLPETLPVTTASLKGGMPSLAGGLPGALGVMPGLFPPLLRPGLGPGHLPGALPLGALVAGEKPLSFEEFNRLKALAAAKQQPQPPPPHAPRSRARSRSRSPSSLRRSPKDKDSKRRSSSKRRDRSASRSPGRRRSDSEKRHRKHRSEKESSSRQRHHSSSARRREAEPMQAWGAGAPAADARRKASGFSEGLDSQHSNGYHGARDPLGAAPPSRMASRQLPSLPSSSSRDHGVPRPSRLEQQQQPPPRLQNVPYQGRGYARPGRDVNASSPDRRFADRDAAARLSKRRSRPSPDDRWEEYSVVVAAPPRASPESPARADEPPSNAATAQSDGGLSEKAGHSRQEKVQSAEEPAVREAAVRPRTDEADDGRRVRSSAGQSASPLRASPLHSGDAGLAASQPPAQSAAEVPTADRSGSHGPTGPEEPPRVAVIEIAEEKDRPIGVQAGEPAEREEAKREKKKKHKKHKDKKHKHRDNEAAKDSSPAQPDAAEAADAPAEEQKTSPVSPEEAAPQDAAPEQAKIVLQRNPPMIGKQLAQQRAAAMRSAVQEDEDALASGAPSRGAVAALAPAKRPAPSLWARALSGLTADAQPQRQSILQRLSKPAVVQPSQNAEPRPAAEEQSDAVLTAGRDRDDGRSPRKRSRRDALAGDAEGHERERGEKIKKHKKKHRSD